MIGDGKIWNFAMVSKFIKICQILTISRNMSMSHKCGVMTGFAKMLRFDNSRKWGSTNTLWNFDRSCNLSNSRILTEILGSFTDRHLTDMAGCLVLHKCFHKKVSKRWKNETFYKILDPMPCPIPHKSPTLIGVTQILSFDRSYRIANSDCQKMSNFERYQKILIIVT